MAQTLAEAGERATRERWIQEHLHTVLQHNLQRFHVKLELEVNEFIKGLASRYHVEAEMLATQGIIKKSAVEHVACALGQAAITDMCAGTHYGWVTK